MASKFEAASFSLTVATVKADGTAAKEPFLRLGRIAPDGREIGAAYLGPASADNMRALYASLDGIRDELVRLGKAAAARTDAPTSAHVDPPASARKAPAAPAQDEINRAILDGLASLAQRLTALENPAPAPAPTAPAKAPAPAKPTRNGAAPKAPATGEQAIKSLPF